MSVPCGHCLECLEEKRQAWCFRLDQELRACNVSYFVTLTYDDEHLTYADDQPCLVKRDLQLHFKSIRKRLEARTVKYFAVGEYGLEFSRPHYHYLIFYHGIQSRFDIFKIIKDCWTLGFSKVLPVSGAQGYVTKYVLKLDNRDFLVKPFSMISNGLGISYLTDSMIAFHKKNLLSFATKPGGYRITLPRYYKDKIFNSGQKLIMKKRADMHRHDLELARLKRIDFQFDLGLNPFQKMVENYQNRLYRSIHLYKNKRKL